MSFGSVVRGAITRGFTGYFDFKGVATRSDYWTWVAAVFAFNLVMPRFSFLLIIPSIAYGVRRMHDVGKSGWWLVLWPVAFFYSLKPSRSSGVAAPTSPSVADAWMSARVADAQSLAKTVMAKFEVVRDALKKSSTPTTASTPTGDSTDRPAAPPPTSKTPTSSDTRKHSAESATTTSGRSTDPADIDAFMKLASGLGIVATSDESPVAVVQSLIRRIWSQVRSQQESDPLHTDHLRLAIRALAEYANDRHGAPATDPIERAKAIMWYGILLAIVSTDDRGPTTLGSLARQSSTDALRQARSLFETKNDMKMAGRCMEELGQLGRLLGRSDLMAEGFDEAVKLFNLAGATDRAKQALTNAGANYQRHSSAFFDGGQHSLKATTILGSVQGERLRAQLHHLD